MFSSYSTLFLLLFLKLIWCQKLVSCSSKFLNENKLKSTFKSPVVQTEDGLLQGTVHKSVGSGRDYYAYKGIPYAKPPLGLLRFKSPVKNDPWKGIFNATNEAQQCVQTAGVLGLTIAGSEDCLYLNVYTTNVSNLFCFLHNWFFLEHF